ncbi:MAG: Crp/Fnr family transcriptional regulator [Holophagaceae bacterium]
MLDPMDPADLARTLARAALFTGWEPEALRPLAAQASVRRLARGEAVWHEGEAATAFTVVRSGLVKILRRAPDGGEIIVALFGPRESIGDAAVLAGEPYPAAALAASEEASVVRIPAPPVLAAMRDRAVRGEAMIRALASHNRALQDKILILGCATVPRRLAALLLTLAERFGEEPAGGGMEVPVALSRGELARFVHATLETVSRTMSAWGKAGLVETREDGFRIPEPARLRALLEAD